MCKIKCAFDKENGCAALKEKPCMIGKPCSFFKSREKLEEGRKKAMKRVRSLPINQKRHIFDKYYTGTIPPVAEMED